ncbi:MAG: Gfo/Idh/MocA family protein [Candidatus Acidiferrales bacterium]
MVRVAIIGLGAVTRNIHLPAYAQINGLTVVGGCDVDGAAREFARQNWNLPFVCESPIELIEKTRPEFVSICSPPALHREHAILALRAGCQVFCEKPVAEDLDQADEIIEVSERTNRTVVVNSQFPYMRIHSAAKQKLGSPEFGRLLYLHAWQTFCPTDTTERGWRGQLKRRLCFEFGIHVFELIRSFFDDNPTRIFAHMPTPERETHHDVINVVSTEFADGRAASMVLNRLSKAPERYLDMRLDGEVASIHTSLGGRAQITAGIHTREKRPFVEWRFAKGGQAILQTGHRSRVIARDPVNPFAAATAVHFRSFIDAMRSGATPRQTARDNRNTLAMVLAAYDSAQLGRAVEMSQYQKARILE